MIAACAVLLRGTTASGAVPSGVPPCDALIPHFTPPAVDAAAPRRPLLRFDDGRPVRTPEQWRERRREIADAWNDALGPWPPMVEDTEIEVVETARRETFVQHRVRLRLGPARSLDGYLLVPDRPGAHPAVLVPYYDAETSVGLRPDRPFRDYGLQLARRGFVTLSIGTPGGDAWNPDLGDARCQPLAYYAWIAANAWRALASRPDVDAARIGVCGHSYGGKWAMFAAAFWEPFAAVAVSDPGIVFDESRPNVNYWEPWYLGADPERARRRPGLPSLDNPATGAYARLVREGRDLHEIHALIAPRPFLVSGGAEDPPERWRDLGPALAVNALLEAPGRIGLTSRPSHEPTAESHEQILQFLECFLGRTD